MEFARQQRNKENLGSKDLELKRARLSKKTLSPVSKEASSKEDPAKQPQHFRRAY